MFKSFLLKQMLKSKLKNVPKEQQDQILAVIEKNPEFFQTIATEVQVKIKEGRGQEQAMMEVMQAHQVELKELLQK